jgi:hypothetical protein
VIPPEAFKSKRAHVVILNDAAWSIVQAQRGLDPIWVFPHRGRRMSTMDRTTTLGSVFDEKLAFAPFVFMICGIMPSAGLCRVCLVSHCFAPAFDASPLD